MLEILDMRTILQVGALVCLTLAAVMVYYSLRRKTYPGFHYWTVGIVSIGIGAALVSMRNVLPGSVSIIIGNMLIVAMPLTLIRGLSTFTGITWKLKTADLMIFLLFALLYLYWTYISPNIIARIICLSMTLAFFYGEATYIAIEYIPSVLNAQEWLLVISLAASTASCIFRAVITAFKFEELFFLSFSGQLHSIALILIILGVVASSCSFLILNSHRMEIELTEARRRIEKLLDVDEMCNIFNRRYFNKKLYEEFARLQRLSLPLSLIMADIDFFKRYNDTYGHPARDSCIHEVADTLQKSGGRVSDIAARYGGEEFVMLLPNTDAKGARKVALAIQKNLQAKAIPHETSTAAEFVTLSIGIATVVPDRKTTPDQLVRWADHALYQSKNCGRNTIQEYRGMDTPCPDETQPDDRPRIKP
ncbi:diguanylate cyclase domain-containing protein [Maridesulfovibrio sp. FT414]|uniref:GGDEF domain-containing protein n=1 Tax=Maridesulfovibrio sp. FT414 TaxID=2979469 RepID=UPI003D8091B3